MLGNDLAKLWPLIPGGQSDTACFDNALELLVHGGYSLAHAVTMLIPEAWAGNPLMDEDRRAFYEHHAALMEPWDGPAAMTFTDGKLIGVADPQKFGQIDKTTRGLKQLPCEERAGMIFVVLTPGAPLDHPYVSPLFGDFGPGFPPTLLTAGTRDLFLSNAARMNNSLRRSGNYSELIIEEAMPHGGFFGAPEDQAFLSDIVDFADRGWNGHLPKRRP